MAGKRRSDLPIKLSEILKLMENHTIGPGSGAIGWTARPLRRRACARPRCLVPGHVRRRHGHQQGFRPGCQPLGAHRTGTEAWPAARGERARAHPGRARARGQPPPLRAAVTRLPGATHRHRPTCTADPSTRPRRACGGDRPLHPRSQRERSSQKLGLVALRSSAGLNWPFDLLGLRR
jgi:hypothetical protein